MNSYTHIQKFARGAAARFRTFPYILIFELVCANVISARVRISDNFSLAHSEAGGREREKKGKQEDANIQTRLYTQAIYNLQARSKRKRRFALRLFPRFLSARSLASAKFRPLSLSPLSSFSYLPPLFSFLWLSPPSINRQGGEASTWNWQQITLLVQQRELAPARARPSAPRSLARPISGARSSSPLSAATMARGRGSIYHALRRWQKLIVQSERERESGFINEPREPRA